MPRDERIDKGISWGLTFLVALAIGWLSTEVRSMRDKIDQLGQSAAVVKAAQYDQKIEKLAAVDAAFGNRLSVLETKVK